MPHKNPDPKRRSGCPLNASVEILGDRWSLLIIRDMMLRGFRTYKEFLGSYERIATNILADRLQKLITHGIITANSDPSDCRKLIYSLTPKGIDLAPVLTEMVLWAAAHEDTANQALVRQMQKDKEKFISAIRQRWAKTTRAADPNVRQNLGQRRTPGTERLGLHCDRSASVTSTRAARAAGSTDATIAAASRYEHGADDRQGARRLHILESASRQTHQHVPKCCASGDTCRRHHRALRNDTRQELPWLRSNGQPDAELACPRANGECQHAGDADQSNGQSDGRKDTEHNGVETIRSENFGANIFESSGALNGLLRPTCRE